jgi:hypothetical protein
MPFLAVSNQHLVISTQTKNVPIRTFCPIVALELFLDPRLSAFIRGKLLPLDHARSRRLLVTSCPTFALELFLDPRLSALISGKLLLFPITAMTCDHGDYPFPICVYLRSSAAKTSNLYPATV